MGFMALKEINPPKKFEDVKRLIDEYNYMKELIKKAEDGKKILLGFIYNNCADTVGVNHETLDYTWGHVFAECLKERCKLIEKYISEDLNKNNT